MFLLVLIDLEPNADPDRLQAFLADVGQVEDFAEVEKKALALGAERMVIDNLQQEFVDELIFRAIQCMSSCPPMSRHSGGRGFLSRDD